MTDTTQPTLLNRLRDGTDQLSWEEFFRCYWPMVYAFARHRGCSEHTAEEVVQDVLLKVFETRDLFRHDPKLGRFRDWLSALVRNKVAEFRRRPSERVRARGGDADFALAESNGNEAAPEDAWEKAFESALLTVLLDTVRREVNPRTFLAFELSAIHDLSGAKVAEVTGMSRNAVYKSCKRVLKRLQELGAEYGSHGRLHRRIKEAIAVWPAASVERSLTARIERTMRSR
ncbi:MAG: RNA polymerase sigma factor [Planctomycetota bacterium]|jgi:RNA polymerase sigma-70 factor (ECF subfamily)